MNSLKNVTDSTEVDYKFIIKFVSVADYRKFFNEKIRSFDIRRKQYRMCILLSL